MSKGIVLIGTSKASSKSSSIIFNQSVFLSYYQNCISSLYSKFSTFLFRYFYDHLTMALYVIIPSPSIIALSRDEVRVMSYCIVFRVLLWDSSKKLSFCLFVVLFYFSFGVFVLGGCEASKCPRDVFLQIARTRA
jgi:hypothetical protein